MRRPSKRQLANTAEIGFAGDPKSIPERQDSVPRPILDLHRTDVFDKVSKTLADQAGKLGADDAKLEENLRPKVAQALMNYATDQSEVGRLLWEYKGVYKTKRKWTSVAEEIGKVINCSARTIFRMIDDYGDSLAPTKVPSVEIDRSPIIGIAPSKQERLEQRARLAIRVFLNNISKEKKLEALASLLAEEAYQVWGTRESFSIEVIPRPSSFTIDGRKRRLHIQADEEAA